MRVYVCTEVPVATVEAAKASNISPRVVIPSGSRVHPTGQQEDDEYDGPIYPEERVLLEGK